MKFYQELFEKELFTSVIPFWLTHGRDEHYGGVINCLDRAGEIYSEDKSVWMQGRAAWTFSYLYNKLERKEEYLAFAKSCLAFAREHCIDPEDGRMYFTVTRDGRPLRKRRYFFSETFYVMANADIISPRENTPVLRRRVPISASYTISTRIPQAIPTRSPRSAVRKREAQGLSPLP